jgi:hypothetical protein
MGLPVPIPPAAKIGKSFPKIVSLSCRAGPAKVCSVHPVA